MVVKACEITSLNSGIVCQALLAEQGALAKSKTTWESEKKQLGFGGLKIHELSGFSLCM